MQERKELTLDVNAAHDVATVRCQGRLTVTSSGELRQTVKPLLAGRTTVTLDLTEVTLMDSVGLGTIVSLYVSARNANCRLLLVNITPRIREIFSVSHVLSLFEAAGDGNVRIP